MLGRLERRARARAAVRRRREPRAANAARVASRRARARAPAAALSRRARGRGPFGRRGDGAAVAARRRPAADRPGRSGHRSVAIRADVDLAELLEARCEHRFADRAARARPRDPRRGPTRVATCRRRPAAPRAGARESRRQRARPRLRCDHAQRSHRRRHGRAARQRRRERVLDAVSRPRVRPLQPRGRVAQHAGNRPRARDRRADRPRARR